MTSAERSSQRRKSRQPTISSAAESAAAQLDGVQGILQHRQSADVQEVDALIAKTDRQLPRKPSSGAIVPQEPHVFTEPAAGRLVVRQAADDDDVPEPTGRQVPKRVEDLSFQAAGVQPPDGMTDRDRLGGRGGVHTLRVAGTERISRSGHGGPYSSAMAGPTA
jgi:hypothetical protein